jgi:hypothetical protein
VFGEPCKLGFDVPRFCPRTVEQLRFFIIRQMQYARETLPETNWVKQSELRFSRWRSPCPSVS